MTMFCLGQAARLLYRHPPPLRRIATSPSAGERGWGPPSLTTSTSTSPAVLEDHSLTVPSFGGSLVVNSPMSVDVRPINPMDFPDMDRATVKVLGPPGSGDDVSVSLSQEDGELSVSAACSSPSLLPLLSCSLSVPCMHGVEVTARGRAGVVCKDMVESDYCRLTAEEGQVIVGGVKTVELTVNTQGGDVLCQGAVQGRVTIRTGAGSVSSDRRFLGPELDIATTTGDISIASCYSDQSSFRTRRGSLTLNNLHHSSSVSVYEEGSLVMKGLDGSTQVFVKRGGIDLQVSRVRAQSRVELREGDILLKLTDSHPLKLSVSAREVEVAETLLQYGSLEEGEGGSCFEGVIQGQQEQDVPTLEVLAGGGKVTIERQSWAASLGLRMSEKDGVGRGREEGWRLPITEHSREAWSLEDILREEREKGGQE